MKKILFVSTGRCGTARLAELLGEKLGEECTVIHQKPWARLANVIGHIMYYTSGNEAIKRFLFGLVTGRHTRGKRFICSDPLVAMVIPGKILTSSDTCIIHVTREPTSFAKSFMRMTRQRFKSFVGHNFIPFWQLGILPLENILNRNVEKKYERLQALKNAYFEKHYSINPNYSRIDMEKMFDSDFLEKTVNGFFGSSISIGENDLKKRANVTRIAEK